MAEQTVDSDKMAEFLNLTPRRLRQLVKEGILPKESRGQYPVSRVTRAYIQYLQGLTKGLNQHDPKSLDRDAEELRKIREQADKLELENALKRREQLRADDVREFFLEVAVIYGTQLDALAGRLAGMLPGEPGENRKIIFAESRAIRSATADRLTQFAAGIGAEGGGDGECPAAENSGPVGGRKPRTSKGKRGAGPVEVEP